MTIKIYKFGGMSLEGKEKIGNAVSACVSEVKQGTKLVCVVSAMGKTTDELFALVQKFSPMVTVDKSMTVIGMGEIISARVFDFALRSESIASLLIEPFSKRWPIILKGNGSLNRRQTEQNIKKHIRGFFKKIDCIVIPGFIAMKKNGDWGTLGRGGSDTTAFIMGKYLKAEEIVMVKDVDGVFTADPSIVPGAKHIRYITADELLTMSAFGAQVIHSDALSFKGKQQKLRIINHSFGNVAYEGTVVDGKVTRKVFLLEEKLSLITFYKEDLTGDRELIEELTQKILKKTRVFGTTLGIDYLGFYVPYGTSKSVLKKLWTTSLLKKVSVVERKNIALLIMKRESPVNLPGMINYLLTPLAKENVNIVEVITIGREILLFVPWEDREIALHALKKRVKKRM